MGGDASVIGMAGEESEARTALPDRARGGRYQASRGGGKLEARPPGAGERQAVGCEAVVARIAVVEKGGGPAGLVVIISEIVQGLSLDRDHMLDSGAGHPPAGTSVLQNAIGNVRLVTGAPMPRRKAELDIVRMAPERLGPRGEVGAPG